MTLNMCRILSRVIDFIIALLDSKVLYIWLAANRWCSYCGFFLFGTTGHSAVCIDGLGLQPTSYRWIYILEFILAYCEQSKDIERNLWCHSEASVLNEVHMENLVSISVSDLRPNEPNNSRPFSW